MKRGAGKVKGGKFERLICKKLSRWWTDGKRDDVFYRTASSGGRATQRAKKGSRTFGQYGDIQAADPIGQPLMDLCVIECKDGYASDSITDMLDREPRHKPKYEQFLQQVKKSKREAHTSYWLLIARRRGRQIVIYMPVTLYDELVDDIGSNLQTTVPILSIQLKPNSQEIVGVPFEQFLKAVPPEAFTQ